MSSDRTKLKNFGKVSTGWLNEIGIYTLEDLQSLGAVETYKRVKEKFPHKVTLNMLWGLEAALTDMDWRAIPAERKEQLKREVGE